MAIPCSTTPAKRFGPRLADQAPLVDTGAGVVPQDEGWFVVNALSWRLGPSALS
jgi:hypothetical protein